MWASTSSRSRYDAAPRSIGAVPPPAAAAQEAPRNSSLVATRSCARLRTRSGSTTTTWVSSGITSMSSSISSTSTGANDSIPSTAMPAASLVGHLGELRVGLTQRGGASAYFVGEQQLPARWCPEPLDVLDRPLVGNGEGADLVDLVAPELHADRVLLGRREDVDQTSADRELAALLHQVDPGVRRVREPPSDVVQLGGITRLELDRLEVAEPAHLGLQDRPNRRHDDAQPARRPVDAGVSQSPQDGQPATHGVAARAEALVRQRLPARVVRE